MRSTQTIELSMKQISTHSSMTNRLLHRQPTFVRVLHERVPALTRQELLICLFLREGLASGEIASKLHCSVRTVENHRYNIRKKLRLSPSEDLSLMMILMSAGDESGDADHTSDNHWTEDGSEKGG